MRGNVSGEDHAQRNRRYGALKRHPAKYSDSIIPVLARELDGCKRVYDPFAGTGKIANIMDHGFDGEIYCCEIEPEWAHIDRRITAWFICDAEHTSFIQDEFFDAICTSPTYGNRMADHFEARDGSRRITYRHYLERPLHPENTGRMQWGKRYREKHEAVYAELYRVLKPGGLFVLNVSDHIRGGKIVRVSDWHLETLKALGFSLIRSHAVETPRMRMGANHDLRVPHENVYTLQKP